MPTIKMICRVSAVLLAMQLWAISQFPTVAQAQDKKKAAVDNDNGANRKALAFYANAADYQNNGAFELAIEEWQKLVTEYPQHPQASTAWHHLGVCNLQRKEPDYASAVKAFSEALKDPKLEIREESLINLSWALYTQARQEEPNSAKQKAGLEQARARMTEFLKGYGDGGYVDQALFYLGDIEHLLGDRKRSIAYFKKFLETKALSDSKLRPDALYALAVAHEEEQQLAEANRRFATFLTDYPQHRLANEVRLRTADLLLKENKPAEAEKLLSAISTDKSDSMADYALLRLGYTYALQGRNAEATAQYLKLLEQFPDSKHVAAAALSVGQALYQDGKYDAAIVQFRKVLDIKGPQAPDAAHWLAITWLRQNKAQEAMEMLKEALPSIADSPLAITLQMDYADALYAIPEQLEQARLAYEKIATDHPQDALAPRAAYNAAFAALQTRKLAEARSWAEKFLSSYPQDPLRNEVAYVAAEVLLQQGEHAAAAEAYAKLIAADRKNPSWNLWNLRLGMAHYLAGGHQKAADVLLPLIGKFPQDAQNAEAQFIVGGSFMFLEQPQKAIELLLASHQTNDRWSSADEALLLLAEAYQRNKDNDSARKTLEKLLEKYPKSRLKAQAEYKLAQLSAASGNLEEAIRRYQTVVGDPAAETYHNFATYGIAWSLMQQEKYAPALKQLQPLLAQKLRDSIGQEARLAEGVCLRKLGRIDEAVSALEAFMQSKPTDGSLANGLYELGLAYTEQGKLTEATTQFQRIVQEMPGYPALDKVLYELAWNYQDAGDAQRATEVFAQLAEEYPQGEFAAEANYMLAERRYESKEYEQAAKIYTSVMASARDNELQEKSQYKLGWSLFQQARYEPAGAQFAKQASAFPTGPLAVDALFMKAECAFKQERFDDALKGYQAAREALEANSDKTAASAQVKTLIYLHGGQALRELKRWDECESWLKVVIERYPESPFLPTALYEMGYCKQNQNKLQEALTHYAEVAGDYRTEVAARARFMMGEVYFSQRDFVKAIPEFQRVMFGFGGEKAPDAIKNWQAKSAFEAARCSEVLIENLNGNARQKVVDTAKEFYEFIVQKHAAHELAAKAQTRLGELQKLR